MTIHDIFISHSKHDRNKVGKVRDRLAAAGFDVYVDFDDPALGEITDRALADRLRNRIIHSRALLFVLSARAANSKWMPWKLGLAHGAVGRILIWPLSKTAGKVIAKQEYLSLYRRVDPTNPESTIRRVVEKARRSIVSPGGIDATPLVTEQIAELTKFAQFHELSFISAGESSKVLGASSEVLSEGSTIISGKR